MDPGSRSLIKITLPSQYEDRQPIKDWPGACRAGAVEDDAIDA